MSLEQIKPYTGYIVIAVIIAAIAGGIYIYKDMNKPQQGSWRYALCRTFVEMELRYPETLRVTQVIDDRRYSEIYASYVNAHGMRPTRVYKCNFEMQPNGRPRLESVYVEFDKLSDEKIAKFNQVIPILLANLDDINRDLPNWEGLSLEALRPD